MRLIDVAVTAAAVALLASACTPTTDSATTSTEDPAETTSTTGSPRPTAPVAGPPQPPELPDPTSVAAAAVVVPPGYEATTETDLFIEDAAFAIGLWLPDAIVAGTAQRTLVDGLGDTILVVSVIPTMSFRGDPTLVPALADLDSPGEEVADRVHRTVTDDGLVVHLWSTGDGFLVAASSVEPAGRTYLSAMEADRSPLTAWTPGTCLYFPDAAGLPWAPFPTDPIVPCDGPHNAEVIEATQDALGVTEYDDEAITYQRNYECDRAYESVIGPQRDHTPSLITYMPDRDEFERGDRYLACVIQVETGEGTELVVGPITERDDLEWRPAVGDCFGPSLAPEPLDCADVHGFEFVAEIEFTGDAWPADQGAQAAACAPVLDDLPEGPAPIDVFAMGLYPYAFEQGERSIRCMAFVREPAGVGRVIGSFTGEWRVLAGDGVAA